MKVIRANSSRRDLSKMSFFEADNVGKRSERAGQGRSDYKTLLESPSRKERRDSRDSGSHWKEPLERGEREGLASVVARAAH